MPKCPSVGQLYSNAAQSVRVLVPERKQSQSVVIKMPMMTKCMGSIGTATQTKPECWSEHVHDAKMYGVQVSFQMNVPKVRECWRQNENEPDEKRVGGPKVHSPSSKRERGVLCAISSPGKDRVLS